MVATSHCDESEVTRIAQDLSAKYGYDAVDFAQARVKRATEIGDDLAQGIWEKVLAAVSAVKAHRF